MILVTGATGSVGSEVTRLLCDAGHPVRALVRNPERADVLRGYDCRTVLGDFGDPASLDAAMTGARAALLVSPVGPHQPEQEQAVVDAAVRAGGVRLVKVAAIGFAEGRIGRIGENHRVVVEAIRTAGLPHTVLAPNDYFQNLLAGAASVQERGVWAMPRGEAPVSSVDARDVAAVAAAMLAADAADGAVHTVTGPESLTGPEVAVRLSHALDREVRYVDLDPEQAARDLRSAGVPDWHVGALTELWAAYRSGATAAVTDVVHRSTGRAGCPLEGFLTEHRSAFLAR